MAACPLPRLAGSGSRAGTVEGEAWDTFPPHPCAENLLPKVPRCAAAVTGRVRLRGALGSAAEEAAVTLPDRPPRGGRRRGRMLGAGVGEGPPG